MSRKPTVLTIRKRTRFQASPPAGLSQDWTEWQVMNGRKVLFRGGTRAEAEAWAAALTEEPK